jgi:hypothetical protein
MRIKKEKRKKERNIQQTHEKKRNIRTTPNKKEGKN